MPYSAQLFAGSLAAGVTPIYTVPAGYTAVVRDIEALNLFSGANVLAFITTVPGPLNVQWTNDTIAAFGETLRWEGRVVMNPGDVLSAEVTQDTISLIVSGYLFSGP